MLVIKMISFFKELAIYLVAIKRVFHSYCFIGPVMAIMLLRNEVNVLLFCLESFEPRCEKTGLRGYRPGPTQTGLYNQSRWLEA